MCPIYVCQGGLATGRITLSPKKSHLPLPLVQKTGREAGLWKRDAEATPMMSSSCSLLCLAALDGAEIESAGLTVSLKGCSCESLGLFRVLNEQPQTCVPGSVLLGTLLAEVRAHEQDRDISDFQRWPRVVLNLCDCSLKNKK